MVEPSKVAMAGSMWRIVAESIGTTFSAATDVRATTENEVWGLFSKGK